MKSTIFITSQVNKVKIPVGSTDAISREAVFEITPKRFFVEADAFGIDADVFRRKSIEYCQKFVFNFWDGRRIALTRQEFMGACWLYPSHNDPDYKAPAEKFKPKLVLTLERAEEIIKSRPKETEDEMLERMCKNGDLS